MSFSDGQELYTVYTAITVSTLKLLLNTSFCYLYTWLSVRLHTIRFPKHKWRERRLAFMTLKSTSWPKLSFSLKNSCSGYVRAISLRISFSQGDVIFRSSEYWSLMGIFWALHKSCHTIARKWWGTPFLTRSCGKRKEQIFCEIVDNLAAF